MTQRNPDPYGLLGVTPAATSAEITHAFRTRLRALHPDTRAASERTNADDDAELGRILTAYVQLRRLHHDRDRDRAAERRERASQPPMFRAGPVRRHP